MTAEYANWLNANWVNQEVRLTFCDHRAEVMDNSGMAQGFARYKPVAEIVMTRQAFEGALNAMKAVPMCEPWPPAPPPEEPEQPIPPRMMTRDELIQWADDLGILIPEPMGATARE